MWPGGLVHRPLRLDVQAAGRVTATRLPQGPPHAECCAAVLGPGGTSQLPGATAAGFAAAPLLSARLRQEIVSTRGTCLLGLGTRALADPDSGAPN